MCGIQLRTVERKTLKQTDEELMQRAKNGEMRCISSLFDRYNVRLYNFFYQQTRDKGQSEDLTQNVFERVIKYRHKYENRSNFTSWIFAIARNVHIDLYRKKRLDLPGNEKVMFIADQPEVVADSRESLHSARLKAALNKLSPEQQQLIYLTRFEKMKYAEVARIMECSEGAVKVKIHRTMKNLKDVFLKLKIDE